MGVEGMNIVKVFVWLAALAAAAALAVFAVVSKRRKQPPRPAKGEVVFWFAGIGDADSILIYQDQHALLIDTGREEHASEVKRMLAQAGIQELELLILTHPDRDHIGGAAELLESIPVKRVIQSGCPGGGKRRAALEAAMDRLGIKPKTPSRPKEMKVGDIEITVYPAEKASYKLRNDYSLLTLVRHGEVSAFFAGDAQKKRLKEALALDPKPCTLYKVAHHGKGDAGGAKLIKALSPKFAVVTENQADEEIREALRECGTRVFYSGQNDVYGVSDGRKLKMWQ